MAIIDDVRAFVRDSFYPAKSLADGDSLLDTGTMDSTGTLELMAFLEEHFGIVIDDTEVVPENFDSIAAVAALVGRKLAPPPSARGPVAAPPP
ncbi:MAG TPA: acyl carrier protein [Minicystis sp.]|nr:acyl carrier protein [Minicystis sp.]